MPHLDINNKKGVIVEKRYHLAGLAHWIVYNLYSYFVCNICANYKLLVCYILEFPINIYAFLGSGLTFL